MRRSYRSYSSRYSHFAPYVPVAERRRQAEAEAKKAAKNGKPMNPVRIEGRAIARTFWGKAWCENLESYSDYSNRLPRGRTYIRNGSVIDLQLSPGTIEAVVAGSSLYRARITIAALDPKAWGAFKSRCAGKIASLIDLLQGRLDKGVLAEITRQPGGLFPAPKEIKLSCSCPDSASLCKHLAAVLYGVGARLDSQPELFFTLRAADMQELITAATTATASTPDTPTPDALAAEDLSALFGVDIDMGPVAPVATTRPPARTPAKKSAKKAANKAAKKAPARATRQKQAATPRAATPGASAKPAARKRAVRSRP